MDVSFENTLTIGRQYLFVSKAEISLLINKFGANNNLLKFQTDKFADNFIADFLDAKQVDSIDYSDYEGCKIVHDLNKPVDISLHEKYDAVIDGGSLEHIFHAPNAIESYMNLVKKGGSLFIFTTANNHLGHGFYQFSPEFFFNIFYESNGFELRDILLDEHNFPSAELDSNHKLFRISNPFDVKSRVGLVSKKPAMIMIHAIRKEIKPLFATFPIQSDYQPLHAGEVKSQESKIKQLFNRLPKSLQNYIHGKRQLRIFSLKNKRFYKKIDE
jgi:SAM-dependent methyltransferase